MLLPVFAVTLVLGAQNDLIIMSILFLVVFKHKRLVGVMINVSMISILLIGGLTLIIAVIMMILVSLRLVVFMLVLMVMIIILMRMLKYTKKN